MLQLELLEIIEKQTEIIVQQKETIDRLVNENAEQENMINELMSSVVYEDEIKR